MPSVPRNAALAGALSLSGTVLGGLAAGAAIGQHWGWNPKAALIGLFLGIAAGFYNLARSMLAER